ncbi:MAG: hypothetical protein JO264_10315 [Acidisphaera sp.]|nr:hypothetical protein [Acidisphaera sp.]
MAADMSPYGTMALIREGRHTRFVLARYSVMNARTFPTMRMMQALAGRYQDALEELERRHPPATELLFLQYDDRALHDVCSVAYGKRLGEAPAVRLIPDTYFFEHRGYEHTRARVRAGELPRWEECRDMVFWRGTATHDSSTFAGEPITELEQIPRVAMCLALRAEPRADAAVMSPWGGVRSPEEARAQYAAWGILRPKIPMLDHAQYRFLIDIDGVANAWGFFDKLLMGRCVLKVGTAYEQWFYGGIAPWEHFVPVQPDLSDLTEKLEWCFDNDDAAQTIAERGQSFAMAHSFDRAMEQGLAAMAECTLAV